MSQTKRYKVETLNCCFDADMIEAENGEYVLHSDYSALVQQGIRDHQDWRSKLNFLEADYKAEVARLTAEKESETKATFDAIRTISQLRDENERLRKAAQAVELAFQTLDNGLIETPDWVKQQAMRDAVSQLRAAAKEGSDAK